MLIKKTVQGVPGLPSFCHAVAAGNQLLVSGMLGTRPDALRLVDGGIRPQTQQALRHLRTVLEACGCTLDDVAKVNVYLTDMTLFGPMNEEYAAVFGSEPPARVTVGCSELALGALVEVDCIAFLPDQPLPRTPSER